MALPCPRCQHDNTDGARFCVNCGALLDVSGQGVSEQDPMIGRLLTDKYRITEVLGEGGMGKVYRAEQKMGTAVRDVAIKILHRDLTSNPQVTARFRRECETVITLHHPNTVQFFDFGELPDGTLYIVMELIEGQSLASVLQAGPIDAARVEHLVTQICGSLHEAHDKGIVHRDLKPENVLLTEVAGHADFVKVLDFGIAKQGATGTPSTLTEQGMILGTPPYMSPEQFSGVDLDRRSDVYSLGVMTYEMLTGRLPFEANTPWEWAAKHLNEPPEDLDAQLLASAIPNTKKRAIMQALKKTPEERQPSAQVFAQMFASDQESLAQTAVQKPLPEALRSSQAPLKRRRWGLWLALPIALAAALWLGTRNNEPDPTPDPGFDVAVGMPGTVTEAEPAAESEPASEPEPEREPEPEPANPAKPTTDKATSKRPIPKRTTTKKPSRSAGKQTTANTEVERLAQTARRALRANRFDDAIDALAAANTWLPKTSRPRVALRTRLNRLTADLERRGANRIAVLIANGQCERARALYVQLKRVHAQRSSARHFSSRGCRLP